MTADVVPLPRRRGVLPVRVPDARGFDWTAHYPPPEEIEDRLVRDLERLIGVPLRGCLAVDVQRLLTAAIDDAVAYDHFTRWCEDREDE